MYSIVADFWSWRHEPECCYLFIIGNTMQPSWAGKFLFLVHALCQNGVPLDFRSCDLCCSLSSKNFQLNPLATFFWIVWMRNWGNNRTSPRRSRRESESPYLNSEMAFYRVIDDDCVENRGTQTRLRLSETGGGGCSSSAQIKES